MEMPKTERVLITGGAGFIGNRVANILHAQGMSVGVVDNLASGLPMPAIQQRLRPFLVDIRNKDGLARAFDDFRPDRVVHLAAVHHIPTVEKQRDYAHEVDIVGTELVLGQCERHQVGLVTMASSAAVYAPVEGVLHEDSTPLQAIDNYSLCKLSNEHQAKFWTERTGGNIRLIRFFNTVGHDDPTGHLLPDILKQLYDKTGQATVRLGNTTPRRDYVHVDDSAAAAAALTTKGEIRGPIEAFNICRGEEFSVLELVEEIGRLMGLKINVETDPERVRPVDRQSILGSNAKLRERTGWNWRYDFPAIVRRTVEGMGFATKA
jgi:UDP-glucose 4-epimerase